MKKIGVITISSGDYREMTEAQAKLRIVETIIKNATEAGETAIETRKLREVMGIPAAGGKTIEIPEFIFEQKRKAR